jgi:CRISPR system Cascade subunit CasD
MNCLLLRLDAPLMSFGGVMVDETGPIDRFPGRSLLTGLLGNALGYDHSDIELLQALQSGLLHASRWDAEPELLVDYQTVDLGQDFMRDTGWTTRGRREDRGKGAATSGTHQRWRHYWANGCATVAVKLRSDTNLWSRLPELGAIERALRQPARPIFIGRKTCMPAEPVLLGLRSASTLREALMAEPLAPSRGRRVPDRIPACWPIEEGSASLIEHVDDVRDWTNNIHRGRQPYAMGFLEVSR